MHNLALNRGAVIITAVFFIRDSQYASFDCVDIINIQFKFIQHGFCCHLCLIGAPNGCVVLTITPPSPDVHLLPSLPYWHPKSMCGPHHHPLIPRCAFVAISASSAPQSMCGSHHLIPIPSDVHILIPMTKGQDKRSQFHHHCHHPTFFLQQTKSSAAKRDLGVASQGEIHPCTSSTLDRSTGRFEAMPHSFVWLLKRVPLSNCHVDHDRPSMRTHTHPSVLIRIC